MTNAYFLGSLPTSIIAMENDRRLTKPRWWRIIGETICLTKSNRHYSAEIAATNGLSGGASKCLRTRSRSSGVSTPASGNNDVTCTAIE